MIKQKKPPPPKRRDWGRYSSVGLMFPTSMAVGFLMGYGLDSLFHTSPLLTVIFFLYGVAAGFVNLFRIAKKNDKK